MKNFIRTIFYGNIFYGLCAVSLSIEANLQHGVTLNSSRIYILIFLATLIYYSRIYYKSSLLINVDDRTNWYRLHRPVIKVCLILLTIALIVDIAWMVIINRTVWLHLSPYYLCLLIVVPLLGILYSSPILPLKKLRAVGWLKPFVIGFVWAGIVTIFPILFWQFRHPVTVVPSFLLKALLWFQNFLFVSTLAIVFDIKDYEADRKHKLKTYPAHYGINHTIRYVIQPLTIASFALVVITQIIFNREPAATAIQAIPYLILLAMSKTLGREKSLLFYLAAIDGLMLLKGICGIISIKCI